MPRPIFALINSKNLKSNLEKIKKHCNPLTKIWSVVKSNAYGHGLNSVYVGLNKSDGFAVLDLQEAIFLREKGWKKPILLLEGIFQVEDLMEVDHYYLHFVIHNKWQMNLIRKYSPKKPFNVYVKYDSGMNRFGFNDKNIENVWNEIRDMKKISSAILMTHFASIEDTWKMKKQIEKTFLIKKKINCKTCLANSASILWYPNTHQDWVRPGIILYGSSPNGNWKDIEFIQCLPVMTLQSKIIEIKNLLPGSCIGYNRISIHKPKKIGIVACGYGDGYPRNAPSGTPILVDGIRTKLVGSVSMDVLTVDLDPCLYATIGSTVELWGENIKIDEVAAASKTVGYQLMCNLSSRVSIKLL